MRRKIFFLALVFITALTSQAQITVTGTVFDADEGEPLEYAVTAIMRDTAIVGRANTDEKGVFTIPVTVPGMYKLRISYIGYTTFSATFNVEENQEVVNLDTILLGSKNSTGNRAIVTATIAKVQQVEDTTVYNAAAYRVPEGSTLEALIKQLPGVQVSDEGTITWNGKTVSEFLINGKDFFKGNTDVAMKNLPTDLVSKIKAYDRKSDYTQQTGIDDGEETTVMDISTKRELNQSWITNITAGYGTKHRYSSRLFISRFTDKSHITLMASANNVNDRGFGGPRGFGGSNGLTATKSINFSGEWDNGKKRFAAGRFEIEGDIRFNHRSTDVYSKTSSETFLATGSTSSAQSFGVSQSQSFGSNTNLNANMEIDWSPDSMTSLSFRPQMSYSNSRNNGTSLSATFNDDPFTLENIVTTGDVLDSIFATDVMTALSAMTVNRNRNFTKSKSHSFSTNASLTMTRRLGSSGRNVNLSLNGGFGNSKSRSYSISNIDYMQQDRSVFQNIYSYNPSKNWNYSARVSYVEPLGKSKKWFAEVRYQYSHRYTEGDRQRYALHEMDDTTYRYNTMDWAIDNFGTAPTDAEILSAIRDERNSQYAEYHYSNHNVTLGIRHNGTKIRTNLGVSLNPQHTKMDYNRPALLDTVVTRNVFNVSPEFNFRYSFSRTNNLEFRFRGSASQPSMTDLLDVWDDSNPLSISGGNPNLKPAWTNSFNAFYRAYNTNRQQGMNARLSFSQTLNSISSRTVYDEVTGVSYTRPDNINGNWNAEGNFMFNTPLDYQKQFNLTTFTMLRFQRYVGYMSTYDSGRATPAKYDAIYTPRLLDETVNYQEIFDNATGTSTKGNTRTFGVDEALTLTYKQTYFDLGANGNVRYQNVRSTLTSNSNMDTWEFSYGISGNLNTNIGISFSTDIRMSSRRGYSSKEMNTNELLWNAQLSYSFLSKAATVRLQWNDILQKQSNISRTISATSRVDRETNAINSYFMVSFTYKFNFFGGTSKDQRLQQRRGPGQRGDGPPPEGFGGGRPSGGGGFGGGRGGGGF